MTELSEALVLTFCVSGRTWAVISDPRFRALSLVSVQVGLGTSVEFDVLEVLRLV